MQPRPHSAPALHGGARGGSSRRIFEAVRDARANLQQKREAKESEAESSKMLHSVRCYNAALEEQAANRFRSAHQTTSIDRKVHPASVSRKHQHDSESRASAQVRPTERDVDEDEVSRGPSIVVYESLIRRVKKEVEAREHIVELLTMASENEPALAQTLSFRHFVKSLGSRRPHSATVTKSSDEIASQCTRSTARTPFFQRPLSAASPLLHRSVSSNISMCSSGMEMTTTDVGGHSDVAITPTSLNNSSSCAERNATSSSSTDSWKLSHHRDNVAAYKLRQQHLDEVLTVIAAQRGLI